MTEVVVRLDPPSARPIVSRDAVVGSLLFCLALVAYFTANAHGAHLASPLPLGLFVLLAGSYVALGVPDIAHRLNEVLGGRLVRIFAGPAVLWSACVVYAVGAGLSVGDRALDFAVYLAIPSLVLSSGQAKPGQLPWRELAVAASLGAGVKYHLLPALPVPAPGGYDASRLVGLVAGLYFFLVARPLDGVGYRWLITRRDAATAVLVFLGYAAIALPIGFGTGFIRWNPRAAAPALLLQPVVIYLVTAVPEEFLFRGLIQNLLSRWLSIPVGLAIASVIFGLSHLPDPRYAMLATIAGVAYGFVYLRTGKVTAAAITHALVDAVWVILLHR
ncbi:MAG TPA: type II CAAX endopeptidase family protein [Gemmatimonadaceae bacterium]|nr:type II CAAX endopeptidase family protein [Gemmatimonadaceae bacterium]